MDPRFTPARRLQEKARNRDSDVDISELQAFANPPARTPAAAPTPGPFRPGGRRAACREARPAALSEAEWKRQAKRAILKGSCQ